MKAPINDGGRAFPEPGVFDAMRDQVNPAGVYYDAGGMSLRDYFAAKTIASVISGRTVGTRGAGECQDDYFARRAYEIADAMLLARFASRER